MSAPKAIDRRRLGSSLRPSERAVTAVAVLGLLILLTLGIWMPGGLGRAGAVAPAGHGGSPRAAHLVPLSTSSASSGLPIAKIWLSTMRGHVGQNVTLNGAGYGELHVVSLSFAGSPLNLSSCSLGTLGSGRTWVTASALGTFSCVFAVPRAPHGTANISAVENGTRSGGAGSVESITTNPGAWGASYDPRLGEVFVSNINTASVTVYSDTTNSAVATVGVGYRPHSTVFDAGSGQLFVANYDPGSPSGSVSVVSAAMNRVVTNITVGAEPAFLAYDAAKAEVFVSNYGSSNVSVISDVTDRVVAWVAVSTGPQGLAYDRATGEVYVACGSGNVSVISDTTNKVVASIPVGGDPWGAVYDPGQREVFVTQNASQGVSVISDTTNQVITTVTVGIGPTGGAYDPMTGTVFIETVPSSGAGSVAAINDSTDTVGASFTVGDVSFSMALDVGQGELWVPNQDSGFLSLVLLTNRSLPIGSMELPSAPGAWGASYDPSLGEVFVSNINSASVTVYNDSSNSAIATVGVGNRPHSTVFDNGTGQLFVANYDPGAPNGSVSVVSAATNLVVANVTVGTEPAFLAYDAAKGEVFVSNYGSSAVSVISQAADLVVATVPVGGSPQGLAYDPGTGQVFVACGTGNVSVISDATNQVVASIPVGADPWGAVYDPGQHEVFVTQNASQNVSVISDTKDRVVASVLVGAGPTDGAYDPVTGTVFIENVPRVGAGNVTAINDTNDSVSGSVMVGNVSFTMAFDSGQADLWVPNQDSNFLSVIGPAPSGVPFHVQAYLWMTSSGSGAASSALTLAGSGYAASSSITFGFAGVNQTASAACATDTAGSFSGCGFAVPSKPFGVYAVTATDAASNVNANAVNFTVTAAPVWTLEFRAAGLTDSVTWSVTLTGLASGMTISTLSGGDPVGLTRSASGSAAIGFNVSSGPVEYTASAPGFAVARGTATVTGSPMEPITITFSPTGTTTGSGSPLFSAPEKVVGGVIAGIAALGLGLIVYRGRSREKARGKALVDRLARDDWELEERPAPPGRP